MNATRHALYDPPDHHSFESGFRAAARPLMFNTGLPDFPVASYGGTLTLLEFEGAIFAVTCNHEIKDFDWRQLVVTPNFQGGRRAPVASIFKLSHATGEAVDSEILDLVAIQFSSTIDSEWFDAKPKMIDEASVAECDEGDLLCAIGCVNHLAEFGVVANVAQGELHVHASRRASADITIRHAAAYIATDPTSSLDGLSGGPVYRISDQKFCGITVRGGISDELANIYFVEAGDILQFLRASRKPGVMHKYQKHIIRTD